MLGVCDHKCWVCRIINVGCVGSSMLAACDHKCWVCGIINVGCVGS